MISGDLDPKFGEDLLVFMGEFKLERHPLNPQYGTPQTLGLKKRDPRFPARLLPEVSVGR